LVHDRGSTPGCSGREWDFADSKRDEFGLTAFPSIRAAIVASEKQQSVSGAEGDRRMVTYFTEQMFSALKY